MAAGPPGPYQIKAAISALHVGAKQARETDWLQIVMLYDSLLQFEPSPVVELNRGVALAEMGQLDQALQVFEALAPDLQKYQPFHAATAEYFGQANRIPEALHAYDRAIELAGNSADRQYLQAQKRRLVQ